MSSLTAFADTDDSWVDAMSVERIKRDHIGHRVLDWLKSLKDWPPELVRAIRYNPRKTSAKLNRLVMFVRLSKFVQFVYLFVLVFCGLGPVTVASIQQDSQRLGYMFLTLLIIPLWFLEQYFWKLSYISRHTIIVNEDPHTRPKLYVTSRDVRTAARFRQEAS